MAVKDNSYYHVGLTDDQVRKSRAEHGENLLTPPKRPSMWKLYLEKFEDMRHVVLGKNPKVMSTAVSQMREELKNMVLPESEKKK